MEPMSGSKRSFPLRAVLWSFKTCFFAAMIMMFTGIAVPQLLRAMTIHTAEETVAKDITQAFNQVTVKMFNGYIKVEAVPQKNATMTIVKRGSGYSPEEAKADLKNIDIQIAVKAGRLEIIARRLDNRLDRPNSGASASLQVPVSTSLLLASSNGEIDALGPVNAVTASTSNNPIQVVGAKGPLTLETSNDPINVDGGSGKLVLKNSNGEITVVSQSAEVLAETSNSAIRFEGGLLPGTSRFSTSNDDITLVLGSSTAFSLDGETSNGEIRSDFKFHHQPSQNDQDVVKAQTSAHPAVKIICRTSNSDITINKK